MRLATFLLVAPALFAASDNFNRSNGPLGASWNSVSGFADMTIGNNGSAAVGAYPSAINSAARWIGSSVGNNYYSQIVPGSMHGTAAAARMAADGSPNFYDCSSTDYGATLIISRWDSGTRAQLTTKRGLSLTGNDTLRITVTGTNPVSISCSRIHSGSVVASLTVSDSSESRKTTGTPGMVMYGFAGNAFYDNWAADAVPAIVESSIPDAGLNTAYSVTLTADEGTGPYTFSATGLPSWASLSSAGVLSGTPDSPSLTTAIITVTDASGNSSSTPFLVAARWPRKEDGRPDSTVLVTNRSGGAQMNAPITMHREFAQGEIRRYAKPLVNGSAPAVWQNDVRTRWRDEQASCSITGINTVTGAITCPAHDFEYGDRVFISGIAGSGEVTGLNGGMWTVADSPAADTFKVLNWTPGGTYTSSGTVKGPAYGTLKGVDISLPVSFDADAEMKTVTFIESDTPCSVGDMTACNAAAVDITAGTWSAVTQTTASGVVHSAAARAMLAAGAFRYWRRGPAVTTVIIEDRTTRNYDFGYQCGKCTDYPNSTWTDDPSNKSLHPYFVVSAYANWSGVKIQYIVENTWLTALQDQYYDVSLSNSAGSVYSKAGFTHIFSSRWMKEYWDGAAPGKMKVDLNLPYMVYAKTLPSYDLSKALSAAAITSWITKWNNLTAAQKDIGGEGNWFKAFGTTGGRDDIGFFAGWFVAAFYSFDPDLISSSILGNSEAISHTPNHYRESASGLYHYGTMDAKGLVISTFSRPSDRLTNCHPYVSTSLPSGVTLAGNATCNSWSTDQAHQGQFGAAAYLLTGDYYWLEEAYFWPAWNSISGSESTTATYPIARNGAAGLLTPGSVAGGSRGQAWTMRNLAYAALLAPDGTAEAYRFRQMLWNNVADTEGLLNLTNGRMYDASASSQFQWSKIQYWNTTEGQWPRSPKREALGFPSIDSYSPCGATQGLCGEWVDYTPGPSKASGVYEVWMEGYRLTVYRWIMDNWGLDHIMEGMSRYWIGAAMHPASNPYLLSCYMAPLLQESTGAYIQDWTTFRQAFASAKRDITAWNCTYDINGGGTDNYAWIIRAGFAGLTPYRAWGKSGQEAWDLFVRTQAAYYSVSDNNPQWAIVPRRDPVRIVSRQVGDTEAVIQYIATRADEACTWNGVSDGITDSRDRRWIVRSLSPSTRYTLVLACGSDPAGNMRVVIDTRDAAGAPQTLSIPIPPRPTIDGKTVASVAVDYGANSFAWEGVATAAYRGDPLTLSVPALSGRILWIRIRYLDADGVVLAEGRPDVFVP